MPVTKKGYWQIDMDDVTVSGESITSVSSAILDSGTSLLVGPSEDVKAIAAKVVSLERVFFFSCVFLLLGVVFICYFEAIFVFAYTAGVLYALLWLYVDCLSGTWAVHVFLWCL